MAEHTIIETLAKERTVETIIENVAKKPIGQDINLQDLSQDIYLSLMEKPAEKIQDMWDNGGLRFFITRMVINNLKSKNSRYYYNYIKDSKNRDENYKWDDDKDNC